MNRQAGHIVPQGLLRQPLTALPKLGPKRAQQLEKLGLRTIGDLLTLFPRDYEDRRTLRAIRDLQDGETVCVRGIIADAPTHSRLPGGRDMCRFRVFDATGQMHITYFHAPYLRLEKGEEYIFFGKAEKQGSRVGMVNPVREEADAMNKPGRLLPVYPATAGITQAMLRAWVQSALELAGGNFPEPLPAELRQRYALPDAATAFEKIHRPETAEDILQARRRLIFEELFVLSCGLQQRKLSLRAVAQRPMCSKDPNEFFSKLPFAPTGAQARAIVDIFTDLCGGTRMNRLLQGDVGSGKTLVAAAAAWLTACNHRQTAIMAPTELLARQHAATLTKLFAPFGLRVGLLVSAMTAAEKRQIKQAVADGQIDVLCGTHALIQSDVAFADAGLFVVDEQHRFGVEQRATLGQKGSDAHLLVMSATPIPRTLSLVLYGDLEISRLDELPPGRTPIRTMVAGEEKRAGMLGFLQKQVNEGGQAYVVCPLIEENEDGGKQAATVYTQKLQRALPGCRIGLLHGRQKAAEKAAVMQEFSAGTLDILVSTTVVEVGVDVPNASVMVIENAEPFGLSQLHQLRGRVGRGSRQSWCILMRGGGGDVAKERLDILCRTTDGFVIAEEDLKLRGPGGFLSREQHGIVRFAVADLAKDAAVFSAAKEAAQELLEQDPRLEEHPLLQQSIQRLLERTAVAGSLN